MDKETLQLILKLQAERDDLERALIEIIILCKQDKDVLIPEHGNITASTAVVAVIDKLKEHREGHESKINC